MNDDRSGRIVAGERLGVYQFQDRIGAGGMGEVFRARDTQLGRDVAIKLLPAAVAADPDRVARFDREARMLAALNHPNIATIHGVAEDGGIRGLVMELVEGPTLADRLLSGPLPVPEAIDIARQIVDALETAHDKGIVHRDLKPSNIKITPSGLVKVLDFGLAKAFGAASESDAADAPTVTVDQTREGRVVGTAAYMSPEQARGAVVDKRTDVWAFGCVLYELLTGRAVFARATVSDTIATVLEHDPSWDALPAQTPDAVRRLLRRCLTKAAARRLRDIGDARLELEETAAPGVDPASDGSRVRMWQGATAAAMVAALAASGYIAWNLSRGSDDDVVRGVRRFAIHLPPGTQFPIDAGLPTVLAISPAGDRIAFVARDANGTRLYLQRRDDLSPSALAGTDGAIGPFFSPDGQSIGFGAGGALRMVPVSGGTPRSLGEAPNLEGGSWGPADTIVYSPRWLTGLIRVSTATGRAEPLTPVDEPAKSPHLLPDGKVVLFNVLRDGRQVLEAMDLGSRRRQTLTEGSNAFYLPSGRIVFARGSALFAVPFDSSRMEITGSPTPILEGVRADGNDTHFAVASDGTVVFVPEASTKSRLLRVDRDGRSVAIDPDSRVYSHPRLSPDNTKVVVSIRHESSGGELWIYDLARGARARLAPTGRVSRPIWTADGERVTFQMGGDLFSVSSDDRATPELVLKRQTGPNSYFPLGWSRDGRRLMFSAPMPATNRDIWIAPVGAAPTPFLATPRDERAGMFSPDGHWIVYAVRETGREEQVYVQPYPGPSGRVVISPGGGMEPVWSPTGREIFYRSIDGTRMMSVAVETGSRLTIGQPRMLFAKQFADNGGNYWSDYDVFRTGQEFVILEAEQPSTPRVNVIVGAVTAARPPS